MLSEPIWIPVPSRATKENLEANGDSGGLSMDVMIGNIIDDKAVQDAGWL